MSRVVVYQYHHITLSLFVLLRTVRLIGLRAHLFDERRAFQPSSVRPVLRVH